MLIDHRHIGRRYPAIEYELGREKIKEFVIAVDDLNPLYLDHNFAESAGYGGIIAPPSAASIFAVAQAEVLFVDPEVGIDYEMLVHAEHEFQFFDVLRAGTIYRIEAVIKDIYEKKNLQFIVLEVEVFDTEDRRILISTASYAIRSRQD